jgi:hypothetical protein
VVQLGTVAAEKVEDDMEAERVRASRLAVNDKAQAVRPIQAVEVTENTVVTIFEDGGVTITHWTV